VINIAVASHFALDALTIAAIASGATLLFCCLACSCFLGCCWLNRQREQLLAELSNLKRAVQRKSSGGGGGGGGGGGSDKGDASHESDGDDAGVRLSLLQQARRRQWRRSAAASSMRIVTQPHERQRQRSPTNFLMGYPMFRRSGQRSDSGGSAMASAAAEAAANAAELAAIEAEEAALEAEEAALAAEEAAERREAKEKAKEAAEMEAFQRARKAAEDATSREEGAAEVAKAARKAYRTLDRVKVALRWADAPIDAPPEYLALGITVGGLQAWVDGLPADAPEQFLHTTPDFYATGDFGYANPGARVLDGYVSRHFLEQRCSQDDEGYSYCERLQTKNPKAVGPASVIGSCPRRTKMEIGRAHV
jgi:hypothetical protein